MTFPITPGLNTREYKQESVISTHEFDQIMRRWAVMAQFQADLDKYYEREDTGDCY